MKERTLPVREMTEEEKKAIEEAQERFMRCLMMKEDEKDDTFNSGIFNDVAIGYGKIALETLGKDSKFLREFEEAMERAFDRYDAAQARKIYNRIEG